MVKLLLTSTTPNNFIGKISLLCNRNSFFIRNKNSGYSGSGVRFLFLLLFLLLLLLLLCFA